MDVNRLRVLAGLKAAVLKENTDEWKLHCRSVAKLLLRMGRKMNDAQFSGLIEEFEGDAHWVGEDAAEAYLSGSNESRMVQFFEDKFENLNEPYLNVARAFFRTGPGAEAEREMHQELEDSFGPDEDVNDEGEDRHEASEDWINEHKGELAGEITQEIVNQINLLRPSGI